MSNIKEVAASMIRDARIAAGLTQKELADKLGLTEPAVSRYESGDRNLSLEVIDRIAKVLDLKFNISLTR